MSKLQIKYFPKKELFESWKDLIRFATLVSSDIGSFFHLASCTVEKFDYEHDLSCQRWKRIAPSYKIHVLYLLLLEGEFFRLLLLTIIMHGLNYLLLVSSFWLILEFSWIDCELELIPCAVHPVRCLNSHCPLINFIKQILLWLYTWM